MSLHFLILFQSCLYVFYSSLFMWKIDGEETFVAFQQRADELALQYMSEMDAPLVMSEVIFSPDLEDFALTTVYVSACY